MKFAYARVSANEQILDIEIQKLKAAGYEEIFKVKITGAQDNLLQLKGLLSNFRQRDLVHIVRLERLSRKMLKLIELINKFKSRGIEFVAQENNLDNTTPMGMLLSNIRTVFY